VNAKKHGATRRQKTKITGVYFIERFNSKTGKFEKAQCRKRYTAIKKVFKNGKKVQLEKSFEKISAAKQWKESALVEKKKIQSVFTLEFLIESFFEQHSTKVRKVTLEKYRCYSKHLLFLSGMNVFEITSRVMDEWLLAVKDEKYLLLQHSTRLSFQKELQFLSQIFDFGREYIDENIKNPILKRHKADAIISKEKFVKKKQENQGRFLTLKELKSLEKLLREKVELDTQSMLLSYMAQLQFHTGLRISECGAIEWSDIQKIDGGTYFLLIEKVVEHSRQKGGVPQVVQRTKNGEKRQVPISEEMKTELLELQLKLGRREGLVFSLDGKIPFTYRQVQHFYDSCFKELGIKHRATHILRHSFATQFLAATKNQVALKGILGHRNLSQTDHYAKITMESVSDPAEVFHRKIASAFE